MDWEVGVARPGASRGARGWVTRRVEGAMQAVNIWYPALFILPGSGYHPIMLADNLFGFAGGERPGAGKTRGMSWRAKCGRRSGARVAGRLE